MPNHRLVEPRAKLRAAWQRPLAVFFLVLFLTTGCDALDVVSGESIFLPTSRVLCFEFSNISDGESKTVLSTDLLDLDSFLAEEGFIKSEVIGAEVTGITMRLRFPGQQDFSVFDGASLALRAGSLNATIGSSSNPAATRTLTVSPSGSDIGSIVRAASFQGVLDLDGAASVQDDFLIEVELDFSVEVEGV